jgi:3-oxoadipate enol-lactonase
VVVLVHAVGIDLTYWDAQIAALCEKFDVLAYDLLGHGSSAAPPIGYEIEEHANDLGAIICGTGAGSAHIVGLSVGGMIAQTLAVRQPNLVRSLTLIDTVAQFPDQAKAALRQRAETVRTGGMQAVLQMTLDRWFTPDFMRRRPDVIDRVTKTLLGGSATVHAAMWDAISRFDVGSRLSMVRCPALVMVGEKDPTTPPEASRFIADGIEGARLEILLNASHMSPLEKSVEVNEKLLDFLSQVSSN